MAWHLQDSPSRCNRDKVRIEGIHKGSHPPDLKSAEEDPTTEENKHEKLYWRAPRAEILGELG